MADDFAADRSTTGVVLVNGSTTGRIDSTGDSDWFAVTLTAGTKYRIDALGSGGAGASDPHLHGIYDSAGTLLRGANFNGGIGRDARLWFEAPSTGTYYIAAGAAPGNASQIDHFYSLEVLTDWDDFSADTTTTAEAVADPVLGLSRAFGEIDETDDVDWIAFDVVAGGRYQFAAIGETSTYYAAGTSYLTDTQIVGLYDSSGTLIPGTSASGASGMAEITFTAPATGLVYAAVAGETASESGGYVLNVFDDDFAANISTTGVVPVNGSAVRGNLMSGSDVDWLRVDLTAGTVYQFQSSHAFARIAGLFDASGTAVPGTSGIGDQRGYTATVDGPHIWRSPRPMEAPGTTAFPSSAMILPQAFRPQGGLRRTDR
jgi:hypothetical protein